MARHCAGWFHVVYAYLRNVVFSYMPDPSSSSNKKTLERPEGSASPGNGVLWF